MTVHVALLYNSSNDGIIIGIGIWDFTFWNFCTCIIIALRSVRYSTFEGHLHAFALLAKISQLIILTNLSLPCEIQESDVVHVL